MPGIFYFTGNCFPVSKKHSARMRIAEYKVDVASDRRRRKNVLRHILYRITEKLCSEDRTREFMRSAWRLYIAQCVAGHGANSNDFNIEIRQVPECT